MVRKLASNMAARADESLVMPVFSRTAWKYCSKCIVRMVLAAVRIPSGVSDAWSRPGPTGRSWERFAENDCQ
jgi:hypothetical protein